MCSCQLTVTSWTWSRRFSNLFIFYHVVLFAIEMSFSEIVCNVLVAPTYIFIECANLTGFIGCVFLNISVTTTIMNYLAWGHECALCIIAFYSLARYNKSYYVTCRQNQQYTWNIFSKKKKIINMHVVKFVIIIKTFACYNIDLINTVFMVVLNNRFIYLYNIWNNLI